MNNIWIFGLEPLETRYTKEWEDYLPQAFINEVKGKYNIKYLKGSQGSDKVTPGAFLNFIDTNNWKSSQFLNFNNELLLGNVIKGDKILITDAWNPCIIQIRYMSDLMGLDLKIYSIWHAGSYDEWDFLGRTINDKRWSYNFEKSIYFSSDINFFATEFHLKIFSEQLKIKDLTKSSICGFPFEYLNKKVINNFQKKNQIVFPHRISVEKQPELFKKLQKELPQYNFVFCQEQNLTKEEYWKVLSESKVVVSANKQETLGIGVYEGLISGCIPIVPNKLSYFEMYSDKFKYKNENQIKEMIVDFIENYEKNIIFAENEKKTVSKFFNSKEMIKQIIKK